MPEKLLLIKNQMVLKKCQAPGKPKSLSPKFRTDQPKINPKNFERKIQTEWIINSKPRTIKKIPTILSNEYSRDFLINYNCLF